MIYLQLRHYKKDFDEDLQKYFSHTKIHYN